MGYGYRHTGARVVWGPMYRTELRAGRRDIRRQGLVPASAVGFPELGPQAVGIGKFAQAAIVNPTVRNDAITGIWTESSDGAFLGQFASIAVTRRANTELLVWIAIGHDIITWNVAQIKASSIANILNRNIYTHRGATQRHLSGETIQMYYYEVLTDSPNSNRNLQFGQSGNNVFTTDFVDSEVISGPQTYNFHYKDNVPNGDNFASQTDKTVNGYEVILIERKKK